VLSTEDKQVLRLKRQWELLEVIKRYRIQVPTLFAALMLGITAFVVSNAEILQSASSLVFASTILLVFGGLGYASLREVHRQYHYSNRKISYLYEKLTMIGVDFEPPTEPELEYARVLFVMGYVIVGLTAVFAIAAIWIAAP